MAAVIAIAASIRQSIFCIAVSQSTILEPSGILIVSKFHILGDKVSRHTFGDGFLASMIY